MQGQLLHPPLRIVPPYTTRPAPRSHPPFLRRRASHLPTDPAAVIQILSDVSASGGDWATALARAIPPRKAHGAGASSGAGGAATDGIDSGDEAEGGEAAAAGDAAGAQSGGEADAAPTGAAADASAAGTS